ncbi:DUF4245 domain-containing protein [Nocardia sp. NPDC058058]|uniref:DUF4245 domain-containing protein n=1 Tax=Nocardia sp. NPDC058058 TaxID=3346317 RepID=UPI0036DBF09D
MPNTKPRILNDWKDLFWSLFPLVLICLAIAGIASQCSFTAGGPKAGNIPNFDAHSAFTDDAKQLPFGIREPVLPADWKANSGNREPGVSSTVGYITPQGSYMQVTQSNATEEALARKVAGTRYATGVQQIGDRKWVVYAEPGTEPSWIADYGDTRVLIKGAGNNGAFTTLATAVTNAQPLPK